MLYIRLGDDAGRKVGAILLPGDSHYAMIGSVADSFSALCPLMAISASGMRLLPRLWSMHFAFICVFKAVSRGSYDSLKRELEEKEYERRRIIQGQTH